MGEGNYENMLWQQRLLGTLNTLSLYDLMVQKSAHHFNSWGRNV